MKAKLARKCLFLSLSTGQIRSALRWCFSCVLKYWRPVSHKVSLTWKSRSAQVPSLGVICSHRLCSTCHPASSGSLSNPCLGRAEWEISRNCIMDGCLNTMLDDVHPTVSNPLSMAFQNIRTFVRLLHQLQDCLGCFADRLIADITVWKGPQDSSYFSVDRSVGFPIIFRIHRWHRKKWHRAMSCFETGANISISSLASDHNSFKFGWKKMQIQQEITNNRLNSWKNYSLYIIISKYNNLRLLWVKTSTKSCTILTPHLTQWRQSSTLESTKSPLFEVNPASCSNATAWFLGMMCFTKVRPNAESYYTPESSQIIWSAQNIQNSVTNMSLYMPIKKWP